MEKFDKDITNKIVDNLATCAAIVNSEFQRAVDRIEEAESINEVMVAKKDLMISIARNIPTQDDTCYFCICHRNELNGCDICSYAQAHGKCSKMNDWGKMVTLKNDLIDIIKTCYWTGCELNA